MQKRQKTFDSGKTIYIGNLIYSMDEKGLEGLFGKFGKISWIDIVKKDKGSKHGKGIAFVKMIKSADADRAIKFLNGKIIAGRTVKVSEAIENNPEQKQKELKKRVQTRNEMSDSKAPSKKRPRKKSGLDLLFENTRK